MKKNLIHRHLLLASLVMTSSLASADSLPANLPVAKFDLLVLAQLEKNIINAPTHSEVVAAIQTKQKYYETFKIQILNAMKESKDREETIRRLVAQNM